MGEKRERRRVGSRAKSEIPMVGEEPPWLSAPWMAQAPLGKGPLRGQWEGLERPEGSPEV